MLTTESLRACAVTILDRPLPYVDRLESRERTAIGLVVIHCTELPDLPVARVEGERKIYASDTGNSGHYYIDRDGRIERWVPDTRIAHHTRGWNSVSIGIELVNLGRYPDWLDSRRQQMDEPYPDAQVDALLALLRDLRERLPALRGIAGHEDLDLTEVPSSDDPARLVRRKRDPGPMFPWARVMAECGLDRRFAAALP